MKKCVWLSPLLLVFALFWGSPAHAGSIKTGGAHGCAATRNMAQGDTTASVSRALCALIKTGSLAEMSRPNFADQRNAVEAFYRSTGYALAWTTESKHPTEQALALATALENADTVGLFPADYDGSRLTARLSHLQNMPSPSATELARLDLALTVSAMRYVSDLCRGRLSPSQFHFAWPQKECNTAGILRNQLIKATDVNAVLDQLQPPYEGYRRTLKALNDYMAMAKQGQGELPMPAKPVWSGDHYPGVEELARRLKRLGDMPEDTEVPAGSDLYEDNLKAAIKHFQRRHGLNPDGSLEPDTYRELTVPLERRIAQLQAALEIWRWLPADLKTPWVMINLPEFRLRAFSDDRPTLTMDVVVGEAPNHETPLFVDSMKELIFRPDWRVPLKIQQNEIVRKIESHPTYIARNGFQILNRQGAVRNTAIDDAVLQKLRTGELELRQEPGSENELGLVKFIFPHQNGIYMHGTLARDLFERLRRDFSHGCIRLEDPAALSAWALHGNSHWEPQAINKAINGNATIDVHLPHPVNVVTFYATAMVDNNGEVHFSQDIYGYDAMLEKALAKGRPYLNKEEASAQMRAWTSPHP
ncbi:MAG TPA: L,D-transpeptidase family protein [Candidatus Angelobacter sp.]|nr:L,D-transpeptidase family protein [Candidatus Angelobacter sp.]